jgi:hypothetical protein
MPPERFGRFVQFLGFRNSGSHARNSMVRRVSTWQIETLWVQAIEASGLPEFAKC